MTSHNVTYVRSTASAVCRGQQKYCQVEFFTINWLSGRGHLSHFDHFWYNFPDIPQIRFRLSAYDFITKIYVFIIIPVVYYYYTNC